MDTDSYLEHCQRVTADIREHRRPADTGAQEHSSHRHFQVSQKHSRCKVDSLPDHVMNETSSLTLVSKENMFISVNMST